jgi:hypothetical protein
MLTLKRRRRRRVPPQRGRGVISGLLFCCAQSSMLAVAVPIGSAVLCRCDYVCSGASLVAPLAQILHDLVLHPDKSAHR